jgi:hypothetical protein
MKNRAPVLPYYNLSRYEQCEYYILGPGSTGVKEEGILKKPCESHVVLIWRKCHLGEGKLKLIV